MWYTFAATSCQMTMVKNENFQAKKVKISNFGLQKCYIPQKKGENIYNKDSAKKSKISCKKKFFFRFFNFLLNARGPPKIFDAQFSERFKKNSKNGFAGACQVFKGTKS